MCVCVVVGLFPFFQTTEKLGHKKNENKGTGCLLHERALMLGFVVKRTQLYFKILKPNPENVDQVEIA